MRAPWFARPRAALALLLALSTAALSAVLWPLRAHPRSDALEVFTVILRHEGMDSAALEREAAVPLEDELSELPGLRSIRTEIDYGQVRTIVSFERERLSRSAEVRLAADRVYSRLPPSAHRPEVLSLGESREIAWMSAVSSDSLDSADLARILDSGVKAAFSRVSGVGEVELAGTGLDEVVAAVDRDRLIAQGLELGDVASFLSDTQRLSGAGRVLDGGKEVPCLADGRISSIGELGLLLLPVEGSAVPLGSLASFTLMRRNDGPASRLDGREARFVSVYAIPGSDLISLSSALSAAMAPFEARGVSFTVLLDRGEELRLSFRSVVAAAAVSALSVALLAFLFAPPGGGLFSSFLGALCVPLVLLFAAGSLSLLGFKLDALLLSGLASQIGSAVDADLLVLHVLCRARTVPQGRAAISRVMPSLFAGAAVTVVVLPPLVSSGPPQGGVGALAAAFTAITLSGVFVALLFLPPLLLSFRRDLPDLSSQATGRGPAGMSSAWKRRGHRCLARLSAFSSRRPLPAVLCSLLLSALGLLALRAVPLASRTEAREGELYALVEFEPGTAQEVSDHRLALWTAELLRLPGMDGIETLAREDSGTALLRFDPRRLDRETLQTRLKSFPPEGGFVWLEEASPGERHWKLSVTGDEYAVCRSLAREAAGLLGNEAGVGDVVLNFKEDPPSLTLSPDREFLAALGLPFSSIASLARWAVHAPVAVKLIGEEGEMDLRLVSAGGGESLSPEGLLSLQLPGGVSFGSCVRIGRDERVGRMVRENRQRQAALTVTTAPVGARSAQKLVLDALAALPLPGGYALSFDREELEREGRLSSIALSFAVALLLCYLVTGLLCESFLSPLIVLATVPPSLAPAAIFLALSSRTLSLETAAAFVAVSALAVNAAILCVDGFRDLPLHGRQPSDRELYRLSRSLFPVLASSVFASAGGSLPFIFLIGRGNGFARSLSLVSSLGVLSSLVVALTLIPALAVLFPSSFKRFSRPAASVGAVQTERKDVT